MRPCNTIGGLDRPSVTYMALFNRRLSHLDLCTQHKIVAYPVMERRAHIGRHMHLWTDARIWIDSHTYAQTYMDRRM